MKEAIENHKRKLSMDIQYRFDSPFYKIIFRKKEFTQTTREITLPSDKGELQDIFRVNTDEFRSIFGVNADEFRSIFGVNILNAAWLIHENPNINAQKIADRLSVAKRTAENYLSKLKEAGHIERIGSDKTGHWRVIKK